MNRATTLAMLAALAIMGTTACSSLNQRERGAVIGAGVGAAAGAAIGSQMGSTTKGALIGAVVGGAAGAVIGHQMDQQAEELAEDLEGADVTREAEGIFVRFPSGLMFDFDSAALRAEARSDLADLAGSLQRYPNTEVLIVGHTDAVGTDTYNLDLSRRRARSAADFLIGQGIASARLRTEGRGESEPIATNDTEAGRQQNRRVEVAIVASEEYREQVLRDVGR
ncbi:MAG: OmpA family protein [Longimicrobiales bacterium]